MKAIVCAKCNQSFDSPTQFVKTTTGWSKGSEGELQFICSCEETISIQKGDYDWFNPRQILQQNAEEIIEKMYELRSFAHMPVSTSRLSTIEINEKSSVKDIETQLKKVPYLAMNVIHAANTLKQSTQSDVRRLENAISILGIMTISDLVMNLTLNFYQFRTTIFDVDTMWREANICGKITEYLAQKYFPAIIGDEAFIAGALCNSGKVVGSILFPEEMDATDAFMKESVNPVSWVVAERSRASYSHMVLGEVGAMLWGFPEYVKMAIRYHHYRPCEVYLFDPRFSARSATLAKLAVLANQLMHQVMGDQGRVDETLLYEYVTAIGLQRAEMDRTSESLLKEIDVSEC